MAQGVDVENDDSMRNFSLPELTNIVYFRKGDQLVIQVSHRVRLKK